MGSRASIVKYLYWEELYSIRECAIISGLTEDYIRKLIKEVRAADSEISYEGITEEMLKRKEVIDRVTSLRGAYFIQGSQKYNYISLLSYLGYTVDELKLIFPTDKSTFIAIAALRSKKAWREFDSTIIGVEKDDFSSTFLEKIDVRKEKEKIEKERKDDELMAWKRNNRREMKINNRKKLKNS